LRHPPDHHRRRRPRRRRAGRPDVTSLLDELFSLAGRVAVVTGGNSDIGEIITVDGGRGVVELDAQT
ncbi:MAG: hypothetical protein ACRD0K_17050, partial [Egibacteraceae bacterium]